MWGKVFRSALFINGEIGDCHFSTHGSEIWIAAVGRRLEVFLQVARQNRRLHF